MNILLIGFMGSGKSTLGQRLAKRMSYSFLDLDAEIEKSKQKSVGQIFSDDGEAYFRLLEKDWLMKFDQDNCVISLGGGTPCQEGNLELIQKIGKSVYLHLPVEMLAHRIQNAKTIRPLIEPFRDDPEGLTSFIAELLEKRQPFYEQATLTIDAKDMNPEKIDELISALSAADQ